MADPFVGEIRAFGFNFAPVDWAFCLGMQLPLLQYTALYSVIGNQWGGTPNQSFKLPNLAGQAPIHVGVQNGLTVEIAQQMGTETVTLIGTQMPNHAHGFNMASGTISQLGGPTHPPSPPSSTSLPARPIVQYHNPGLQNANYLMYGATADSTMAANALAPAFGNGTADIVPHENRTPFVVANFCICLNGYFPVRP
jgi:microcystin-dependent protein